MKGSPKMVYPHLDQVSDQETLRGLVVEHGFFVESWGIPPLALERPEDEVVHFLKQVIDFE